LLAIDHLYRRLFTGFRWSASGRSTGRIPADYIVPTITSYQWLRCKPTRSGPFDRVTVLPGKRTGAWMALVCIRRSASFRGVSTSIS